MVCSEYAVNKTGDVYNVHLIRSPYASFINYSLMFYC